MNAKPSLDSIFCSAIEIESPDERRALVEQACGEDADLKQQVERLLHAHFHGRSILDAPDQPVATVDEPHRETAGAMIGPYKLLEQIGEGGMGTVWMAQQTEPIKRTVAIKLIKPGMDSRQVLARFEAERQALALMDHPNIAKVHDAGVTAGRPYIVMELVKGVPITWYCDQRRLTPRQRLELLVPVCQAVQHAHQKGIIHRDLKPSNVLVALYDDKPVPKVIDFGVAKAIGPQLTEQCLHTGFGAVVGTVEYMSPEQTGFNQLDIDTRSDIYSLGVLLYELLAGSPPFTRKELEKAGVLEMLRKIREDEPSKPSTKLSTAEGLPTLAANRGTEPAKLTKLVRGELDWIVMKALEKDRGRRYETANGFAHDIERYLHDEPVQACPPSALYKFKKFTRRNRAALAMASVMIAALVVVLSVVASSIGWIAQDRATRQTVMKERVGLALEEARQRQKEGRWREALVAAKRAEALLATGGGDEEIHQQVREVLDDLQMLEILEQARIRPTQESKYGYDHKQEDAGYADAFRDQGIDIDALDVKEAAERIRARSIGYELCVILDTWAYARRRVSEAGSNRTGRDWKELLEIARAADPDPWRDRFREALQNDDRKSIVEAAESAPISSLPALTVDRLGSALFHLGAFKDGAAFLRKGQRLHPHDFWINSNLGICLFRMQPSQLDDAILFFTAAVALRPEAALARCNLAQSVAEKGRLEDAIAEYDEAIRLKSDFAGAWNDRGLVRNKLHQYEKAVADFSKAIELDPKGPLAWSNRGSAYNELYQYDKALADCSKAIELDPKFAAAWNNRGVAYAGLGQHAKALADFSKAIELDPNNAEAWGNRGAAHGVLRQYDKAFPDYAKAIELDRNNAQAWFNRGLAHARLQQYDKAVADFSKVIELDPNNALAWDGRGHAYYDLHQYDKALVDLSRAIVLDPKNANAWNNRGLTHVNLREYDKAIADWNKAIELAGQSAMIKNNLAWLLASCPDARFRDAGKAVALAKKAVEIVPKEGDFWNTLGEAHYRAGNWKEAVAALEKSMELRNGGDSADWFFLAMAHWQLGDRVKARTRFDQAVQWMEKNQPKDEELGRFRAEAADLLGLTEPKK
jgi:tetratricopeptide (TPR) repeat protein/serine/threonine protein kinase